MGYRAVDVMYSVYAVYEQRGNKQYAESKTNNFLRRCGATTGDLKEQVLDETRVKQVAHAALDIECEADFLFLMGVRDAERKM